MDNEMKNEILVAIGSVDKKVDKMQVEIQEIKTQVAKIPKLEKQIEGLQKETRHLQTQVTDLQKETGNLQTQMTELQKETRNISRSVAIIEHEHGDKLSILFDAFTVNEEKAKEQDKKISFIQHKLSKHNQEIYYLNAKVQGL